MAQAERRLLARERCRARRRLRLVEQGEFGRLAARRQRLLQLVLQVEMILDHALVAPGHEDQVLDTGRARLVDHMLDQRPVHHGEHFLRHRLGGGQEAGAEAGDGENSLADRGHVACVAAGRAGGAVAGMR